MQVLSGPLVFIGLDPRYFQGKCLTANVWAREAPATKMFDPKTDKYPIFVCLSGATPDMNGAGILVARIAQAKPRDSKLCKNSGPLLRSSFCGRRPAQSRHP